MTTNRASAKLQNEVTSAPTSSKHKSGSSATQAPGSVVPMNFIPAVPGHRTSRGGGRIKYGEWRSEAREPDRWNIGFGDTSSFGRSS